MYQNHGLLCTWSIFQSEIKFVLCASVTEYKISGYKIIIFISVKFIVSHCFISSTT